MLHISHGIFVSHRWKAFALAGGFTCVALLQSGREILPHLHESQSRLQLIHVSGTESEHLEDWALSKGVRWGRHRFQQWREPFTADPQRLKRHHDWFMVVRHPVDRLKSESWRLQLKVEELLTSNMVRPLSEDVDASTVQHFVRYESLESDLSKLLESYDLSLLFGRLPKRDAKEPESTNLQASTVQMINDRFFEDFERFNYPRLGVQGSFQRPKLHLDNSTSTSSGMRSMSTTTTPPVRKPRELRFIHITKTGGTAVEDWAKERGLHWGRFDSQYRAPGLPGSPWHHPFPKLPAPLRHRFDWFMVVRHPVQRVVSEYYCPWTGTKTPKTDTEEAFNKFVRTSLDGSRWLHPGSFLAMSDYLDAGSVQHVLRYETLATDLARLLPLYSIRFHSLPKKNVAIGHKFSSRNLWPDTLELIQLKYAADFTNFNYTM